MDTSQAASLMEDFAARTGLTSNEPPTRYLWTDAFAVCNFLGLAEATGDSAYMRLADELIDQVHHTLGRHRDDDPEEADQRAGWLSGLSGEEAEAHPTAGGLRIGKPLPERSRGESIDQRLEWERDGQYFHYLTKWMHALDMMARASREPRYNRWARELAKVAVEAFTHSPSPSGRPRMYWKMSIDLSRPQVGSMGHHDPLDGYVTCKQLKEGASRLAETDETADEPELDDELRLLESMVEGRDWATADPLGLGGLLMDAELLHFLVEAGDADIHALLEDILDAAARGLRRYAAGQPLGQSASRRLAFRELGLAIGLYGVEKMRTSDSDARLESLEQFGALRDQIVDFWKTSEHREVATWRDHQDINDVMLATAQVPQGCML